MSREEKVARRAVKLGYQLLYDNDDESYFYLENDTSDTVAEGIIDDIQDYLDHLEKLKAFL
jgi:hypothetical protein